MSSFIDLIQNITPDIYQNLKTAIEIGKWTDGRRLTKEQRELSMQMLIAYETMNLPPEERSGYITPKKKKGAQTPEENILFKSNTLQ